MMNDAQIPDATIKPVKTVSTIWFIPAIAIFIGCWMIYYQWSNEGTEVTIHFLTAEGMEAEKTKIKSRNVDIGEVSAIELNQNGNGVIVTAKIKKSAEQFLLADSTFWVVSPQISHTGVSGLSTLISGVYIEISPGKSNEERYVFDALNSPPLTPSGTPGLHITLNSNDQFAYKKGDPIIYKGLTVGQFEDIYFNFEERVVYYNAFIKAPYHQLITSNTKFWDVSGLQLDLNADGISVKTGNFETMLTNGATFGIPKGMSIGEKIGERSYFDIYESYEAADDERYRRSIEFVVLVSDSIRGLSVGAPVEYRGIQIGKVKSVNMALSRSENKFTKADFKIPVLISLQPGRIGLPDNDEGKALMTKQNIYWIEHGLKAVLRTGNILTGSLYVDLQHNKDQPISEIEKYEDFLIIPTSSDDFSQITAKAEQFMDNLNNMPLNNMSENANKMMLEMTQTAQEFQGVSHSFDSLLSKVEQQQVSTELSKALQGINTLTKDLSSGSQGYEELRTTLHTLTATMNELKPLLNQLKHKPNSLLFNNGEVSEPIPTKLNGAQP
ncbi:intermembrane transport protein PqiB [Colwellia sp. MB02u-18]|uniref:intermembrane transport protein PqiB n=1 Tax=unclassified Colwellia TaxID=196834 RepID=UPI0015F49BE2|nr:MULTISPECIES: intermembrane transport protein PqiB [unclassified Colwellia]MBA6225457.1 intermembrane transport protein PqiB [Colwellia sp. MB3u-45]MBA6266350.1 intermembrane transport protein PqiB [Colwellia sp. MB3u-43]MBA6320638.1 intermembrane transport protein PqiB [Colwellia sp. MB02u-19]MBA6325460.1 intermembrane transport protein PqiB [Colwellia sp. MB02u-18]MBA6331935.1 intermembrane transport protein PqiB [Colwellia sp. MB02u-12]